ncbi:uncharacterized protein LOC114271297 [Camellia sinensis]|uniref:uncharacterized protein LOC114271297 n=1 Tax=Camellia sinensis TaxID=4442 RepID=UPI0010357BCC|nr:uncharacterized protein LOC114271297 [Camellia sinensis]
MLGDPLLRNRRLYCSYHKDYEHLTKDCKALKQFLEELVQSRHLRSYLDSSTNRKDNTRDKAGKTQPTITINMIYSIPTKRRISREAAPTLRREIMSLLEVVAKRVCSSTKIYFSNEDLTWVHHPYNDALVVTVQIREFDVERILIDQGSSIEIIYYGLFKKLGLSHEALLNVESPLYGFNSSPIFPLGHIFLQVKAGETIHQVEFQVVSVPSTYNVIMGKTWLHQMEVVPSTFHQVLHFPEANTVRTIQGDQAMAKRYMAVSLTRPLEVQTNDSGEEVEPQIGAKSAEKLEKIPIDPEDEDMFFLIDKNLTLEEKSQLVDFLL